MQFDTWLLNTTGSNGLANLAWFLRHPVHATRWFLKA
jgi:hypothetical protein